MIMVVMAIMVVYDNNINSQKGLTVDDKYPTSVGDRDTIRETNITGVRKGGYSYYDRGRGKVSTPLTPSLLS